METIIVHFSVRTLARSRKHRVMLPFYLGLAFAIVILGSKEPALEAGAMGGRIAVCESDHPDLERSGDVRRHRRSAHRVLQPLELRSNWVLRIMPMRGGVDHLRATRRSLYALSLAPVWLATAAVAAWMWLWKHPFPCSFLPGKPNMIVIPAMSAMLGFKVLINALNFAKCVR